MTPEPSHCPPPQPGPWFRVSCALDCSSCNATIFEGEQARADMDGGFLCGICGERFPGGGLRDVTVAGELL